MLAPRQRTRSLPGRSRSVNIPAPTQGWNARDDLAAMDIKYAVQLTNWFPGTSSVNLRKGYTSWATFSGQGETLMYYYGGSTKKWFVVAKPVGTANIYDITSGGAVGAAAVSGLTNARFQYVNNTTTGGSYIQGVNGADKMVVFDGTNWHRDGDGAPYDITGVNSQNLIGINLHQNRVWFIQKDTLDAWYLASGAIGGAATKFSLASFCPHGGSLVGCATWTMDAGYGMNDMLAFITSNGDVVIYQGTDPSSAATWSMIGVWWFGAPIGYRSFVKYQGDLLIITQDGVIPMAAALRSSRLDPRTAITNTIQWAMSQAISLYSTNFGWQLLPFPKENMLFMNVPVAEGMNQQQYVMNTITGAWCNFTGWQANCWELINDDIYFGSNGFVGKAWNGFADNATNITGYALQAFANFGNAATQKRFTMMRPTLFTNGSPQILAGVNTDFQLAFENSPLSFSATSYGVWDTGLWDTALWGADLTVQNNWQGANGIGYWGATALQCASQGIETQWAATTLVMESATPGMNL